MATWLFRSITNYSGSEEVFERVVTSQKELDNLSKQCHESHVAALLTTNNCKSKAELELRKDAAVYERVIPKYKFRPHYPLSPGRIRKIKKERIEPIIQAGKLSISIVRLS